MTGWESNFIDLLLQKDRRGESMNNTQAAKLTQIVARCSQ